MPMPLGGGDALTTTPKPLASPNPYFFPGGGSATYVQENLTPPPNKSFSCLLPLLDGGLYHHHPKPVPAPNFQRRDPLFLKITPFSCTPSWGGL